MFKQAIIGFLTATLLLGCGTNTVEKINWCDRDSLILIGVHDVLTPETARQILTHNDNFRAVCQSGLLTVALAPPAFRGDR